MATDGVPYRLCFTSLNVSLAFLESLRALSASFSVSTSLVSTSSSLGRALSSALYVGKNEKATWYLPVHGLHIRCHPFDLDVKFCYGRVEFGKCFSRGILSRFQK